MEDDHSETATLESREPSLEDLTELCANLNELGAKFIVIGGFAVRAAGYDRRTMDIDLLIEGSEENEAAVIAAVSRLPDGAASVLEPGEISKYVVVRVADEVVVDLMRSASGIDYASAIEDVVVHVVQGVFIPFASPRLLLRMKASSVRQKDLADAQFLRRLLGED
jgi:hypothetical protein